MDGGADTTRRYPVKVATHVKAGARAVVIDWG
jgi:hypothetical protein